jgi:hypothetical protein
LRWEAAYYAFTRAAKDPDGIPASGDETPAWGAAQAVNAGFARWRVRSGLDNAVDFANTSGGAVFVPVGRGSGSFPGAADGGIIIDVSEGFSAAPVISLTPGLQRLAVKLDRPASPSPDSYTLYYAAGNMDAAQAAATGNAVPNLQASDFAGSGYELTGLTGGQEYTVALAAVKTGLADGLSARRLGTPPGLDAPTFRLTAGYKSVRVIVNSPSGIAPDGWVVYYMKGDKTPAEVVANNASFQIAQPLPTTLTSSPETLDAPDEYSVVVAAVKAGYLDAPSAVLKKTTIAARLNVGESSMTELPNFWTKSGSTYTIARGVELIITGSATTTGRNVVIAGGTGSVVTKIMLDNATITLSNAANPLNLNGQTVEMTLVGDNTLKNTNNTTTDTNFGSSRAGIRVNSGAKLTIDGEGSLTVQGGYGAAGIGSNGQGSGYDPTGTIIINGGTITATGGVMGAGIGGGNTSVDNAPGGTITINGGTITATGGNYFQGSNSYIFGGGAGIGGGGAYGATPSTNAGFDARSGGFITINGGHITAIGRGGAAGIGGGGAGTGSYSYGGNSGTIIIKAPATGTATGNNGDGIGRGNWYSNTNYPGVGNSVSTVPSSGNKVYRESGTITGSVPPY